MVTAWIPIRTTALDQHEANTNVVDESIEAFMNSLPSVLPLLVPEVSKVQVAIKSPPPAVMTWLCRNSDLVKFKLFDIYAVSASVAFVDNQNEVKPGGDNRFLSAFSADYLGKAISLSLHLGELAYPGTIMTAEGAVTDEIGILVGIEKKYFLPCARPYNLDRRAWPALQLLDLNDVVVWATSLGFGASSFATTRLQRTLAAFTHVVGLGWSKDGEILFRAMQGLEAFYCDGVGDLRRQLAHKSQLWLGQTHDKQNIVGKLYDHRSKFIHGSAKMQYWSDVSDPWHEDSKTAEQFSDAVDFSTKLLLASLQQCVIRRATDVSWAYVCHVESGQSPP
jgi:hypothetical protein